MNRSIKKSISVNELNYILSLRKIADRQRSDLIPKLFEDPKSEQMFLLKDNIRTLSELKEIICSVVSDPDFIESLVNSFRVTSDLYMPVELKRILLSNVKVALFIGAGVSKLLSILNLLILDNSLSTFIIKVWVRFFSSNLFMWK